MKKFYGFYRGLVEKIDDPEGMGRVRCRIMGIHSQKKVKQLKEGIPDIELPWCEQAQSLFGGFSDEKAGISCVPSVGSWVWVFFEQGDFTKPIYFASIVGKNDRDSESDTTPTKTDEVTIINTKQGHKITINDTESEDLNIKIEDSEGNFIDLKKNNSANGTENGITINGEKQLCTKELIEDIIQPMVEKLMQHSHPPYNLPSSTLIAEFPTILQKVIQGMIAGTDTILTEKTRAN
jgi:hypothetical protein